MQEQRPHQQYPTSLQLTDLLAAPFHKSADLTLRNLAKHMGTSQNAKRAILLGTIVQMNPYGQHPFQNLSRRLHMQHSRLARPRPIPLSVDPMLHCNRHILVPGNLPVRRIGLIEQNAANRLRPIPRNRIDERPKGNAIG